MTALDRLRIRTLRATATVMRLYARAFLALAVLLNLTGAVCVAWAGLHGPLWVALFGPLWCFYAFLVLCEAERLWLMADHWQHGADHPETLRPLGER